MVMFNLVARKVNIVYSSLLIDYYLYISLCLSPSTYSEIARNSRSFFSVLALTVVLISGKGVLLLWLPSMFLSPVGT